MQKIFLFLMLISLTSCSKFSSQYFACKGEYVDAWKPCNISSNSDSPSCVYPTDTRMMTLIIGNDEIKIEGNGVLSSLKVCEKTDTKIEFSAYNGQSICQDKKDLSYQSGSYFIHTGELSWRMNIGGRFVQYTGICKRSKT